MRIAKLGLGLVAALVFTIAMTASASASSFLSTKKESLLSTGVQTQVFNTKAGTTECSEANIKAGESSGTETNIQLAEIEYGKCTAFSFVQATVTPADYVFLANGTVRILKLILIKVPFSGCEVSVPLQSVSTVKYSNNGKNLKLEPNVTGILYTAKSCASGNGEFKDGTYKGNAEAMIPSGTLSFMSVGSGLEPLPNETTIYGFGSAMEASKEVEVPVVDWGKETPIMTHGCKGGKVVISVEAENTETHKIESREATLTESPTGSAMFSGNIPVMKPLHGKAKIKITVSGCEHASEEIVIEINCYIDPSGTVVDGNHEDAPVGEATVTLLSSATELGEYKAVENGSTVMSEMNRANPDSTRENGSFGWETIEGFYKVEATKTACGTGTTPAFHVPPPQEKLLITLHCEGEQWKLGEEGGEKPQLAITAPAKKCEGNVRVENVSFGTAPITILKETGIECAIKKKGCEAKKLNKAEKCESELEKPGTKPEYELEVEWKGKKFTRKFPV